jgi:hypothetical protein
MCKKYKEFQEYFSWTFQPLKIRPPHRLEMSETKYPVKHHHIPKEQGPHDHSESCGHKEYHLLHVTSITQQFLSCVIQQPSVVFHCRDLAHQLLCYQLKH